MMSKKKKDKTDEPAKTKTKRSSRKASPKGADVNDAAPATATLSPAAPMLRSTGGGKKGAAAAAALSTNDIARILNINFVAARVRIHRALARARDAFVTNNANS